MWHFSEYDTKYSKENPNPKINEKTMKQYDYLCVGAGLYGAVVAHELNQKGKKVLVIDKRDHIAGNVYTEKTEIT